MTTNLDCAIAVLASHREARGWADEAVAIDMLAQLGLDPAGVAKHAAPPVVDPALVTEADVATAEAAAKGATDKAHDARAALLAQHVAETHAAADVAVDQEDRAAHDAAAHKAEAKEAQEAQEETKPAVGKALPPVGKPAAHDASEKHAKH